MAVAGPSVELESIPTPTTCQDCYLTYGEFCVTYSGHIHKIVEWCQRHDLILKEKKVLIL